MDLGIARKGALVLAATRGLGRAIAEALADEGAHVLLAGRSADALAEVAAAIRARGGTVHTVTCDLADPGAPETLAAAVPDTIGQVDILVLNSGGPPPGRMIDADLAVMKTQWEVMALRLIEIAHRFAPAMATRGWGRILTVGSSGVVQPIPNLGLSNAIRGTLAGWSKSLSNDLAGQGVTVNMILPGRIHTTRVDQIDEAAASRTGKSLEEIRAAAKAQIPAGRYGTPAEFAATAAFLCSAPAAFITGSQIRVDGGQIKGL